jgi:hypothetical protein
MHLLIFNRHRLSLKSDCHYEALSTALLFLLMVSASAAQAQKQEIIWEAGVSYQQFHYKETLTDGSTLNTEKGGLPGLYISTNIPLPNDFQLGLLASRIKGSANYEGMTQAGHPLSTHTTETINRFGAEIFTPTPDIFSESLSGVIGLSYNRWNRKIQPTDQSRHLYEHYRWYELSGGLRHCSIPLFVKGIEQLCITARLIRTERGSVTVRLEDLNMGNPELNLGGDWGGEASLKLDLKGPLTLRFYTKTWSHGASSPVVIQQTTHYVKITEPASQSWLTGIEAGLRF